SQRGHESRWSFSERVIMCGWIFHPPVSTRFPLGLWSRILRLGGYYWWTMR
ncbi:hypothetical protein NDU88_003013, partial [Pleurodeles waltl]